MSNNAHDLSNRLLNALDNNYNVVDMHAVNEIISILEKINITKELLETTRLGKHVNELRRKTTDPTLARRAKVLVKRWRDLVIPAVASPAHTGSNRSSAERQVRRLGGTPLTSPALTRHVVSPAVPSPRPPSRPAWGGYESDSQDVILVDDDPPTVLPPPPLLNALHKPVTPPIKRQPSPEPLHDDKKAKRDKKPKKRRSHSRAGSGTETTAIPEGAGPGAPSTAWSARNGSAHAHTHAAPHTHTHTHAHAHERRRNGCRRDAVDPYAALVNRLPPAGAKKVKTTKELLEQIQSRGSKAASRPASPASPASPDVMLIEPDSYSKVESPLRNGSSEPKLCSAPASPVPSPPLDDEFACEREQCTCGEEIQDTCPAAVLRRVAPVHVHALHNALVPGVNGTRAPLHPHQFAVRKLTDPDKPGLFTSVVPLYKYSDYADDYCVKNISRVPVCTHLPWTEFAPPPPDPPPPPSPPPPRPYPVEDETPEKTEIKVEPDSPKIEEIIYECPKVEAEMVGVPNLEPSERLKAPLLSVEEKKQFGESEPVVKMEVQEEFASEPQEHRTVERTKEELDGKGLYALCESARRAVPYTYEQASVAPVVSLSTDRLEETFAEAAAETTRDELDRPPRPVRFAEWHECAKLGDLIALPYVVID